MVSDENILEAFRNSDDEGYRILMDVYGNYVYTGVLQSNNKIFVIKPINRAIFLSRKFS